MSYFTEHRYVEPRELTPAATAERFADVVGTVVISTEHEIVGRNGELWASSRTCSNPSDPIAPAGRHLINIP